MGKPAVQRSGDAEFSGGVEGEHPDESDAVASAAIIRRQRFLLMIAVVAVVFCVVGMIAVWHIKSPAQQLAEQEPPPASVVSVPVEERVLVQELILRGSVTARQLSVRWLGQAAPSIVTARPKVSQDTVVEGDVLVEVSGRPIIALLGDVPAYRQLSSDVSGKDVAQLQAALVRLGLLGEYAATNGRFDWATSNAVKRLYEDRGYAASCMGSGVDVCLGEVVFVPLLPAAVGTIVGDVGDNASSSDGGLMTLLTGVPQIDAVIPAGQEQGVAVGQQVSLSDDVNRREATGVVATVGAFVGAGSAGEGSAAGYPISVTADEAVDSGWVGANVRLVISVTQTETAVLVVPWSAIQGASDGGYYVQVLSTTGTKTTVPVTTGLLTAGFVEVMPVQDASLKAGDMVVVG
ncbi:MAG: hypothetical protein LBJ43_06665 [Propionibacteriaceae bacterium]|jgi:hypothetical protein|nr:hypothetical protein [Propionibacteriaceae bacterium]